MHLGEEGGTTKVAHRSRDLVTLCEQLLCVVLSHHGLHDFVANRWQHTLVPVKAQVLQ